MMVVSFSMAYRSFRGGSGRLDTHLDTPPSINRPHPDSCLAPRSAVLELADDALSYIAHRVDRADHLLLADHDLVEQAFELRRYTRVDQRRIGLFESPEQR